MLGIYLRKTRKSKKLSAEYLAEKLGVATATVTRWENGSIDIPGSMFVAYLNILGITLDNIFNNDKTLRESVVKLVNSAEKLTDEEIEEIIRLIAILKK